MIYGFNWIRMHKTAGTAPAMGVTAEPSIWSVRVGTGLGGASIPSTMFWNCLYVIGAFPPFRSMILHIKCIGGQFHVKKWLGLLSLC